jgi:hypothetical protein
MEKHLPFRYTEYETDKFSCLNVFKIVRILPVYYQQIHYRISFHMESFQCIHLRDRFSKGCNEKEFCNFVNIAKKFGQFRVAKTSVLNATYYT